jgi:hypothetical protein
MDTAFFEGVDVYEVWLSPGQNTVDIARRIEEDIEIDRKEYLTIISQGAMLWVVCSKGVSPAVLEWLEQKEYWKTYTIPFGKALFIRKDDQ